MEKVEKYLVVKREDISKYLNREQMEQLRTICDIIRKGRRKDGKKDNHYVVVNDDEPYSGDVWKLIAEGEEDKLLYNE